jgi:NADH-quinone oxidoreductase subunit A
MRRTARRPLAHRLVGRSTRESLPRFGARQHEPPDSCLGVSLHCATPRAHAKISKLCCIRQTREVPAHVLAEYLPILLFLIVAGGIGIALLAVGALFGPHRAGTTKGEAYECGFEAFEDARMRFDVRYYLIAILFIIFDLEIAFLLPWAVVFKQIGVVALFEMAMFLILLLLGFVYCWKKGALEWE